MKKLMLMLLLAGSIQAIYAQTTEKKDKFSPNTPLFEKLTDVKKKTTGFLTAIASASTVRTTETT